MRFVSLGTAAATACPSPRPGGSTSSAAARVVEDEALELHHEAASRDRPDAELAARLEQFARLRMASGSWSVAATALESAARLGVDRATRERCALDAVDCWLLAGEPAP